MLALMMLVLPVAGGSAAGDAVGELPGSAAYAQSEAGRVEKKELELKAPESFYLAPAGQQKENDPASTVGLRVEVLNLGKSDEAEAKAGRITADFGDLSGKVRVEPGIDCARDGGAKFDCPYSYGYNVAPTAFYLHALKAARAGDSGSVRFTYTATDGQVFKASTRVAIGRSQLGVKRLPTQKGTKLGDEVELPLTFKNMGEVTTRGVVVSIGGEVEPSPAKRHRNCRYKAEDKATTCSFRDARIRPGETWTLRPAPAVRTSAKEMYERFEYGVAPLDDPDLTGAGRQKPAGGEPGRGSPVRLVKTSGETGRFYTGREEPPQTFLLTQRDTHIDYEAIAAHASGDAGDASRIHVGIRNRGPEAFGFGSVLDGGKSMATVKVTIPPGTVVRRAPREMNHTGQYDPLCKKDDRTYTCRIEAPERGETDKSLEFLLRAREAGRVRVEVPDEPLPRRDPEPANDTATVDLDAAPARTAKTTPLIITFGSLAAAAVLVPTRRRWGPPLRRRMRRDPDTETR